jgi:hypothetical protein
MAHEPEIELAKLLLSEDDKTEYDFWKEAFPLLFNGSIEEVGIKAGTNYSC